jgi:hypothetical protein
MTIDENDQPIILMLYFANKTGSSDYYLEMFWWNESASSWSDPIDLPSQIENACGDWLAATWVGGSRLNDMDYDPTTGYVLIATDNANSEGIFAVDKSGNLKWSDTDIWNVTPGNYKVAIEVPHTNTTSDSECRIIAFLSNGAFTYGDLAWTARFNPVGGEKQTGQVAVPWNYGLWGDIMCCLVPPNGAVSTWRIWGQASRNFAFPPSSAYFYFDMPPDF